MLLVYCKTAELSVLRDRGFSDYSYSRFRNSSRLFATRRSPSASAEKLPSALDMYKKSIFFIHVSGVCIRPHEIYAFEPFRHLNL